LLHKLKYYGLHGSSLELLKNYLQNRTQQVEYDDAMSDPLLCKCGMPQGSILGPLLFIIYVNDMTNITQSFYPILYADDTTLCATLNSHWNNLDNIILNNELTAISNWLKLNKLSLNISKTKAMMFLTPQRHANLPELYIDDSQIEFVSNFNFLGVILNKHLKWNSHIDMIAKKISKTNGIMKRLKNILPYHVNMRIPL
jgi:hypothetical protein